MQKVILSRKNCGDLTCTLKNPRPFMKTWVWENFLSIRVRFRSIKDLLERVLIWWDVPVRFSLGSLDKVLSFNHCWTHTQERKLCSLSPSAEDQLVLVSTSKNVIKCSTRLKFNATVTSFKNSMFWSVSWLHLFKSKSACSGGIGGTWSRVSDFDNFDFRDPFYRNQSKSKLQLRFLSFAKTWFW